MDGPQLTLSHILSYMKIKRKGLLGERLLSRICDIKMVYDPEHDKANKLDHRAFCYTLPNYDCNIYYAKNFGRLPLPIAAGIIVHELGHIALQSGDEARVDLWCYGRNMGYEYIQSVHYEDIDSGDSFEARNIQCLCDQYVVDKIFGLGK